MKPNTGTIKYVDKADFIMYTVFSDRVADTCEACDQGSSCGDSLFIYGGSSMAKPFLTFEAQNYLKSSGAMSENDLYQYMGFPTNWSKITSLKK